MSKFILKLTASLLLLISGFLFLSLFSGGHAAALNAGGCGTPPSNPPSNWGNAGVGGFQNQMASITVYANDVNNNPLNVNYTLKSYTAAGQPTAQIYQYSQALHQYDPGTAQSQHTFQTGETLTGDGGYKCNGWDEIGPGINGQVGNGYVVNCDDGKGNGVASQFNYYVTHIDPPAGQSDSTGKWAVFYRGTKLTGNANSNPGITPIVVTNGSNVNVQLIWTPNTWNTNANSVVRNNTTGQGPSANVTAQPNDSVTFTHTITTSGDPSSYSWSVLRKYPSDGGPVIARNGSGGGTTTQTITINIPPGAQKNDQYCQRITFNNTQGGNPPSGSSSNACVTIKAPTHGSGGSSATSECYGVNITDGGGATINGKAFDSGSIRTLVNVTDSSGQVLVGGGVGGIPGGFNIVQDETLNRNYTVNGKSVTVYVYRQYYHNNSGTWLWSNIPPGSTGGDGQPLTGDQTRSHNCFAASCTVVAVYGNVPGGPGNGVLAGSGFQVVVQVTNAGDSNYLPLNQPTVNDVGVDGYWLPLNGGDSGTATLNVTAASDIQTQTLNFTVKDGEVHDEGGGLASCSTQVPVYQQFTASVTPVSNLAGSEADAPSSVNYGMDITQQWVNPPAGMGSHGIYNWASANFYKKAANGAVSTPCAPSSYAAPGPYGSPVSLAPIWANTCAIPAGSYQAGDEYCTAVSLQWGGGYVGPDGNVVGGVPGNSDLRCPRITNEPYFKISNSSISAGGDFNNCTNSGGVLAGYNNNQDNGGATDRGASVELGALAIIPSGISGVASGQPVGATGSGGKDAMRLTFANNTSLGAPYVAATDTPTLGGNAGTCQQLTNVTPDKPTSALPSPDVSTVASGEYTASGNVIINASQSMKANHQVEVFIAGNVYINSPIKYDNTGAVLGTVPSLIIHATGNIYVDSSVTTLSGTYIAQQATKSDGTLDTGTGKIYTCGVNNGGGNFAPMQTSGNPNIYSNCNNQLVIYGSFVADQINLMRTFGSLRDETPVGGSPPLQPISLRCSNQGTVSAFGGSSTTITPDQLRTILINLSASLGVTGNGAIIESIVQSYANGGTSLADIRALLQALGAPVPSQLSGGTSTQTCASEVFRFSPQIYLSNPSGIGGGGGGGMPPAQSITSLPPVL